MYETNFGFTNRPFSVSPSKSCFFQATEHQKVLDELLVTISSMNGVSILTGDAGTGKTTVCQQIISRFESQFQIQFVEHCNFPTVRALLQTLLYGLTASYEKVSEQELRLALQAEIRSSFLANDQPLLVIVDEAHLLAAPFLEELRVLSDISYDGKPALQLLICGQTNLEETLVQPALSSLNQRIGCQVYLDRMTRQESEAYIDYRIQRVTTEERKYFSGDAIKLITHVSDGLPRCLNQICDHSLMLAFLQELPLVDESIAYEAFADLQQLPLHWNEPLAAASPLEQLQDNDGISISDEVILDENPDVEIDSLTEDRLNQLVDSTVIESDSSSDEFDWDSSDLLSLGDEIETIEIGSALEENEAVADEQHEITETVAETPSDAKIEQEQSSQEIQFLDESPFPNSTDGFIEIVDRYAAIDAGLDPTTLPAERHQASDVSVEKTQLQPPQFYSLAQPFSSEDQTSEQHNLNSGQMSESAVESNLNYEAELVEESNSDFIDTVENQTEEADQNVFQALAHEISEGEETLEELLAAQVYEVCAETRKGLLNALNEISNYNDLPELDEGPTESTAYDMVLPDDKEQNDSELLQTTSDHSKSVENCNQTSNSAYRLDSHSAHDEQKSATSHLKGPAFGRYKNLFTRLRRKQGSSQV